MLKPALVALMLLPAPLALSQEPPPAKPRVPTPLALLSMSAELADFGRAEKEPLALIVAAGMRRSIASRTVDRRPEGATGPAEGGEDPYGVERLLADALALGRNAPALAAMAEEVRASASKGRSDGIAVNVSTTRGGGTDWYRKIRYDAGKYAEAAVELLTGGAVDFFVYDSTGNVVCRETRQLSKGYCGWTPKPGETFDIKIENRQPTPIRYRLSTN